MTNARSLANFATGIGTEGAVLTVDNTNNRIGIATTNPQNDLQVGLGITMEGDTGQVTFVGIVTAEGFRNSDGSVVGAASTDNINTSTLAQFTGGVGIADSIFHIGDDNTAIRFPAADTFTVTTAGEERGRFTSSNQFVLGPRGSARTNFDNGTVSSNLLHIERQGTGSNTGASFLSNTPHADSGAVLYMAKSRSTDNSSATIVSNGDQLGRISFQGADGSNYVEAASIRGHVDGTPGSDDMPGRLSFRTTADGGTSATERLRIKSDGDVYIGNIAHANDAGVNSNYRTLTLTDTGNGAQVHLRGQSPKLFMDVTSGGNAEMYYDTGDLRILSGEPGDAGSTERVRVTSAGLVGIGTNDPATSLEVFTDDDTDINNSGGTNNTNSILRLYNKNGSDGTGVNNYTGIRFDVAYGARSSAYLNYVRTGDNQGAFLFKARNAASSYPELLRITSAGHVGINTVPSSWESGADTTGLQIDGASVACINDTDFFATSNAYWDGSNWKRIQTGAAVNYNQINRVHTFRSSASGSPGSNVSWTNQLVIDAGGNLNITGVATATQFDATSDVALKENIEVIDEPITKLSELKGVTFDWKAGGHSVGVIAQDVEKVLPTAVGGSKDQKTVNYNAIIGLLVESVKDQQKQIEELKSLLDK